MMLRSAMLRRTLLLVISTLFLSTLLTMGIYQIVSPRIFAENKTAELLPNARLIASLVEMYYRGEITRSSLSANLKKNASGWNAYVWAIDNQGRSLIGTQSGGQSIGLPESMGGMINTVFSGQEALHIGRLSSLTRTEIQPRRLPSGLLDKWLEGAEAPEPEATARPEADAVAPDADLVMVGVPVRYGEYVIGAVFIAQTMNEVFAGMRSLSNTIMLAVLGVTLLMLPLAYIVSRRLARPMHQMRDVALSMAAGDFSVRADESVRGEIGELGGALNHLSSALGRTISELMVERNRLRRILNGLSEGIVAVDAQGMITHVNPAMHTLFHQAQDPQEGEGQRLAIAPNTKIWAAYDCVLAQGQPVSLTVHDESAAIHISISALEEDEGRIAGAVGVFRDVTQSERLEQTRRDYVANVSHELRTPLTALRAIIEPLRDGLVRDEAERDRLYGVMLRETLRLSRLVNDMLELSRLQSGVLSLEKYPFSPSHMLKEVFLKFEAHAEDHGSRLTLTLPEEPLREVLGNPDRTEQVLVTLLDNAIKYTPEGGHIDISAVPADEMLYISVRDSGPGVEAQDLPHVFDRFYKADKAHQGNGTGLGLAIAREILNLLGESITVTSPPGGGACFAFTLHWSL